ncbi:unnamed protein product [Chondrus crispus]|uniref:Uncharacterized protein n=1 Tax=Chondrus crispus TaxID=2769 RepID=R7Q6K8_CHOCR|nr:unnamed protein product [Chondrus crispus]CDF33100.1 unnamed protein product [Chondrus crispus]|eukprot:XP_005712903.1 unnamed protein product [Chondrus crispus]
MQSSICSRPICLYLHRSECENGNPTYFIGSDLVLIHLNTRHVGTVIVLTIVLMSGLSSGLSSALSLYLSTDTPHDITLQI